MVTVRSLAGLFILGGGVAFVMYSSGIWTPVIEGLGRRLGSEIGTAAAGANGNGGSW